MRVLSEVVECFGGAGYIEDTGLPRLLRDAQVLPIWEGTTNVLSLDMLRVLDKSVVLKIFVSDIKQRLECVEDDYLKNQSIQIERALAHVQEFLFTVSKDVDSLQANARKLAFSLAHIYVCSLLLEHAQFCKAANDGNSAEHLGDVSKYWVDKLNAGMVSFV